MKQKILYILVAIIYAHIACAQTVDYTSYLVQAWECLHSENCEAAQRNYNVYKELSGDMNASLEEAINNCKKKQSTPAKYIPQGYVDLGLPSGTLWKAQNEPGYYDYNQAITRFGTKLPSCKHFQELSEYCTCEWYGAGYRFIGKNGNSITLPALGVKNKNRGDVDSFGTFGTYWSIESVNKEEARSIGFFEKFPQYVTDCTRSYKFHGCSVRLIYY